MSKDIKVKLYSNSSEFKKEMSACAVQMKNLKSEFEKNRTAVGVWGNTLKTAQVTEKSLTQELENHKRKVKALERAYADSAIKKGKDAKETQTLARRLNNATAAMNKTQNALNSTTQRIKALEEAAKRASSRVRIMGERMDSIGGKMRSVGSSVAMTSGIAFGALVLSLRDAVQVGIDFEKQMSKVQAISGGSAAEIAKLREQAKELGATTVFTASQAADAQGFLAMAGFKVNDIYDAMPGMLSLAAAGQLELGMAADITSNIMSAFALKAKESGHASDVIAYAAANANTNVEQMGEAMKFLAPNANSLGWGMEESAAAIMAFGDAGLQGSIAGQAFGTSLIRLASPTGKASKLVKKLGFDFFDAAGNMKSMPEVVEEMEKGLKGMTKEQQAAALKTIVGAEAYKHWAILLQKGSKALGDNTKALEKSDGAAKKMADTMLDNAHGSIVAFQSALEGAKIKLTESLLPALGDLANKGSDLIMMFNNLDSGTVQTIAKTAVLATGVLGVTTAVATLTAGIGALLAFTGPVGLAIVGGTALLGGISVATYAYTEQLKNQKKQQEEARESALLYGEGVSKATQKSASAYVDLREKAELQLFELTRVSGSEAQKMSSKLVETYASMRDQLIQELETLKKDVLVVFNAIFEDTDKETKKVGEKAVNRIVGDIDKDIQTTREKLKDLKQLRKETDLDISKMNASQQKRFKEDIAFFKDSTVKFAANQKEALAMQKAVTEQQGQLSFEQAKEYNDKIKKVYDDGKKAAKEDYEYMTDVIEKLYAQGIIKTAKERDTYLNKLEAIRQESLAKNTASYEENSRALFSKMARDGKLLDLETGKALERQEKFIATSAGLVSAGDESQADYQERWAKKQIEFLQEIGNNKEQAIEAVQKTLEEFYQGMGDSEEKAREKASEMVANVEGELDKPTSAEQSGKKVAEDFSAGLKQSTPAVIGGGTVLQQALNNSLSTDNATPAQAGQNKGNAFRTGINSTKPGNAQAGSSILQSALNEMRKGGGQANAAGQNKGNKHKAGLTSTKGANTSAAGSLSSSVTSSLAKTSDGGGGKKAGTELASGVLSKKGTANSAGKSVANSAKTGLKSVKTQNVGSDFVAGFINGMGSQNGSLFSAAWNLGKSALRTLKKSIDSHSPSKLTKAEGNNFSDGFALGIEDKAKNVKQSAAFMAQNAMASFKQELNQMAFNIKGAADQLISMKSELTVRNEVDTPALNQKLDALITLLSQQQSGGAGQAAIPQQPIIIHPAAVHMDGQQIATIAFEKGDGRILDKKAADRYNQNAYKGGVRS
ncbi:phage tail tape measure protein [Bacillus velezensis]|uniref:phage tail tape measure protein n=1 Tax=Bacillus velezensis TaxID=492670 RepID=UPI000BA5DA34|nr:phage tail tape measure protein [Bacillus velezensis]MEC2240150.1 phage tail tape measure protein [Bacillus velezensis]MED3676825.1 phage tail tape measure protein [Bacillus velezensis]PAK29102.1 phage tail tape measure protein [Bacillus velezensis]